MLKGLFGARPVNRTDVIMAVTGAAMAVWKAFDTYTEYKIEKNKEINQ